MAVNPYLASQPTHRLTMQDVMQFNSTQSIVPELSPYNDEYIKAMIYTGMGTNVWNAVYGAQAWYQLNTESNLFGVLPKLTWDKSGYRVITNFVQTPSSMGIAETGTLSVPEVPNIEIVKLTPKLLQTPFEVTDIVEQLAKVSQDDLFANLDTLRQYFATMHIKNINFNLGAKAVGSNVATSNSGISNLNVESLDRIISSYAEGTGVGLSATTTPTLAEVIDPYAGAVDRSAGASAFDSYVASASGEFGTLGALTDQAIRDTIQAVKTNGGRTNLVVTGYDTYANIQGIYQNQLRYMNWGELEYRTGLNGVETSSGVDVGLKAASVYKIPLIEAVDTTTDNPNGQGSFDTSASGSSRMFFLDTTDAEGYGDARLSMSILRPTQYLETTDRDFVLLNNIAYEGLYFSIMEARCTFFGAQGKLRDIE